MMKPLMLVRKNKFSPRAGRAILRSLRGKKICNPLIHKLIKKFLVVALGIRLMMLGNSRDESIQLIELKEAWNELFFALTTIVSSESADIPKATSLSTMATLDNL
ncbi:hypothetical protein [Pseudomonas syringae group sp. J309-1]|uniref:hypothetical protein n=1 Tax=Pseudomonas syringae group sp. J309-1 TaxID=3079588 RepID=UPI00290D6A28|nr:hypothetical protein [Pseudomonas syringae group sp. J309-1]MDU8357962.1 hypothetical protein [Pseudomonas syringae group sp. J309-1]